MSETSWKKILESFSGSHTTLSYEDLGILIQEMPPGLYLKFGERDDKKETCQIRIGWKQNKETEIPVEA